MLLQTRTSRKMNPTKVVEDVYQSRRGLFGRTACQPIEKCELKPTAIQKTKLRELCITTAVEAYGSTKLQPTLKNNAFRRRLKYEYRVNPTNLFFNSGGFRFNFLNFL